MKRFFNLVLGALAMLAVAMMSAFITMRLAIHGREVKVPNIAGLSLQDASRKANAVGLRLNVENRFYSADTPAGNILAQSPAPGTTVRRAWAVRVTESLGPQQVSIPNVVGQSERTASINIRRLSLDPGTVASIPAPGEAGVVVAQMPNPNAVGVEQPRVSLLLSDAAESPPAFVMPSLTGPLGGCCCRPGFRCGTSYRQRRGAACCSDECSICNDSSGFSDFRDVQPRQVPQLFRRQRL